MPKKPKRLGVKLWALREATSGYCLCFQLYKGKSDTGQEHGLAYRVVMDLMDGYTNKNHHLYVDDFYASPKLLLDLEAKSTFCCSIVRMNRGQFSQQFKTAKLQRGERILLKNRNMVAVHWFDKRDVFAMSNIHGTGNVEVIRRGDEQSFQNPVIINEYNKFMGGVDQCDQLLSSYSLNRKSVRWRKKIFFRMLENTVVNSKHLCALLHPELSNSRLYK